MHIVGGNILSRVLVIQDFYVQGEYEHLWYVGNKNYVLNKNFDDRLLFGVGYRKAISPKVSAYFSVLWNFIESKNATKTNPVIQAGVGYLF